MYETIIRLEGLCAATNFTSQPRKYAGILGLRDSYFFGKDFYAFGLTVGHNPDVEVITKTDQDGLQKLFLKKGILIGFVLMANISCLAQLKQLYMTGQNINKEEYL